MNWQPIETAPKDGTEILVWMAAKIASLGECLVCWWQPGNQHPDMIFPAIPSGWVDAHGLLDEQSRITHWMPLPEPPHD